MTNVHLRLSASIEPCDPAKTPVLIVGQLKNLWHLRYDVIKTKLETRVNDETYKLALSGLRPNPVDSCPLWLNQASIAALPSKCSRHNTPSRSHHLTKVIKGCMSGGDEFIVMVTEKKDVFASACAIARAFPLYANKSNMSQTLRKVVVEFVIVGTAQDEGLTTADMECLSHMTYSIRLAGRITDTPCMEMNTDTFIEEIRSIATKLELPEPLVYRGEELRHKGFGGIYNVGKAAEHPPAFVCLSYVPDGYSKTIAWVGKGIVYDTGGLSIKGKSSMPGMKRDCGGAAAILGAFYAAVKQGFCERLHAVFCLAENSVNEKSLRPDDIITLYSGKTVEVNNTDAEGRLVLGDGVAFAVKDLKADIIVDLATLTGAQGLATGRFHGGLLTNNEEWEDWCVTAGRNSGDLVHPLVYCPELHFTEFTSALADMKNSSADRTNGEVSCAGLFINSHIGFDWKGVWIHVDMAYPVYSGERATGYGVGLLATLFGRFTSSSLLQNIAPLAGIINGQPQDDDNEEDDDDENSHANTSKKIKLC